MSNMSNSMVSVIILSSALIIAVITLKAILKNKINARLLSVLWAMVLLRLLVPFSVESPVNISVVLGNFRTESSADYAEETSAIADDPMQPDAINYSVESTYAEPLDVIPATDTAEENYSKVKASVVSNAFDKIQAIGILALAKYLWITVAAFILITNFAKLMLFSRNIKRQNVDAILNSAFSSAAERLNIRKKIVLIKSDSVDIPVTYGLFAPHIIIPQKIAESMGEDKLELILMHELMHIKRMDILKNYLWLLAKAMHWFNPLVWAAYRQYISDTEVLCDYAIVGRLDEKSKVNYTQSLLEAAKSVQFGERRIAWAMLSFCSKNTKLRRRIMNILQPIKQSRKQIFVLGILIIFLAAGCFTTACTKADPQINDDIQTVNNSINADYTAEKAQIDALMAEPQAISSGLFANFLEDESIGDINVKAVLNKTYIQRAYIPENDNFPEVVTVDTDLNDFEFISNIIGYFIGDTFYLADDSKADIDLRINAFKNEVEKLGNIEYKQNQINYLLDNMEEQKRYAAEDNEDVKTLNEVIGQNDYSLKAYDKNGDKALLNIMDYEEYGSIIRYYRGDYAIGYTTIGMHKISGADLSTAFNDDLLNDYLRQANEMVNELTDGMVLCNIYVGKKVFSSLSEIYNGYDLYANSDDVCYSFIYMRKPGDVSSVAYEIIRDTELEDDIFGMFDMAGNEYIRVVVDKNGVGRFSWRNSKGVISCDENAFSIIPLSKAVEAFEDNIFDEQKIWSVNADVEVFVIIKYIYLAMMPVATEQGNYIMTPVYAFKGTQSESHLVSDEYIMLISAIDGSVIDN